MNDKPSLMEKNLDDLTVGDALKINVAALAITAGVTALFFGGVAVAERVQVWNRVRKIKSVDDNVTE